MSGVVRPRDEKKPKPWASLIPKKRASNSGARGREPNSKNRKTRLREVWQQRREAQQRTLDERKRQEEDAKEREQVAEWVDHMKRKYYRKGKELTEDENGKLLYAYYSIKLRHHQDEEWSNNKTIEEVQRTWPLAHAMPKPDSSNRGRGSEKWQARREAYVKVKEAHIKRIKKFVEDRRLGGSITTLRHLVGLLDLEYNIKISRRHLGDVLRSNGMKWGKVKGVTVKSLNDPERRRIINEFIIKLNEALEEEKRGESKPVYTDESFIDTTHAAKYSWQQVREKSEEKGELSKVEDLGAPNTIKSSSGGRLILVHAMTSDGLLSAKNEDGNYIDVEYMHQGELPSAMMIWPAGTAKGDYHKNMDSTVFIK